MTIKITRFIKEFIKKLLSLFPYFFLFFCYKKILGTSPALLLIVFFAIYGSASVLSHYGRTKLITHERSNTLTMKRRILYLALVPCPIYLFWFLFSIIPNPSYLTWFITGFPLIILSGLPLYALSGYLQRPLRKFFWAAQLSIYIISLLIGQSIGNIAFT